MSELEYRLGDTSTIDQQVRLFNETFNQNATPKAWKRKHIDNPLSGKCTVMCAMDADKVAGINGYLPMNYEFKGKQLKFVQSCDTAVDPAYRGQGIFLNIMKGAEKHFKVEGFDAVIGFPNADSYHVLIDKYNWIELTRTMKYFYPNTVKSVAKNMLNKDVPAILNPLANVWRGLFCTRYLAKSRGFVLEKQDYISAEEYMSCLNQEKIHIDLQQDFLDWKLSAGCTYYIAKDKKGDIVCKLLVCNYVVDENYLRGNILILQRENADAQAFRIGAAMILKELSKKYDILSVWQQNDEIVNESLKKLGFIENFSEKDGSPFIIMPLTEDEEVLEVLKNPNSWEPSFIEADYVLDSNVKETSYEKSIEKEK